MRRCRLLAVLALSLAVRPAVAQTAAAPKYEVYAVEYAVLPQFPVADLVSGADKDRKLDIAMLVWVIRGGGHIVLFDSGFYREKFMKQWKPKNYSKPSEAVRRLGIRPADVTDVIISHAHWDHADGADLFPKAKIWLQKDEYQYYTGVAWQPDGLDLATAAGRAVADARHGGVDPDDLQALLKANTAGRLRFVDGDDQEVLPGIRCYTGGKHTYQSQYCSVATRSGAVVLASDNVYLYENLDKHAAIAQTLDAESNLRAQDRMKQLATKPELIVPGHDPAELKRFPKIADGVVRID
jgi:glyoxylase-like metal-dependent hydrolase (beta-lactamase superfamily II)